MSVPALNWQYVTDPNSPQWRVKGTRLAQAVYGFQSRFAIVELRTYDFEIEFGIADATTVSDADTKAGKLPKIVKRYPTLDDAIDAIDRASAKLQAEYDAQTEP